MAVFINEFYHHVLGRSVSVLVRTTASILGQSIYKQVVHSDIFGSRTFDEAFERSCGGPLCLGTDLFADHPCKFFLEDLILVPFRNFVLLLISG